MFFFFSNGCKPNCETGRLSKRNVTAVSMTFAGFPKSYFFINLPDNRGIFLTLPILQFVIGQTKMAAGKKPTLYFSRMHHRNWLLLLLLWQLGGQQ